MADSEEETIDRQVVALFVSFALALYEVSTLYTILAIKACGIMLEEDFDILGILYALLHYL